MPFFRDTEHSIHYLERGSGDPLLLIHGLGCSGANWAFQVSALERHYRVIVPDLPGAGHSDAPSGGYSIEGFAAAMWKLLDHLGCPGGKLGRLFLGRRRGAGDGRKQAQLRAEACAHQQSGNLPAAQLAQVAGNARFGQLGAHVGHAARGWLLAARLFPEAWQRAMRLHTAAVVGAVPATSYLGMGLALARWAILDRPRHLDQPGAADRGRERLHAS